MRGKIIQYSPDAGTGVINTESGNFDFSIRHWRSATAPALNQTVDIVVNGTLEAVFLVDKSVLLKEGMESVRGQVNSQLAAAGGTQNIASGIAGRVLALGYPLLATYVVMLLAITLLPIASVKIPMISEMSITLWGLSEAAKTFGSGDMLPMLKPILWLSMLSIFVPILWQDRRAYFALLAPSLVLIYATFVGAGEYMDYQNTLKEAQAQAASMGAEFGAMGAMAASMANSMMAELYKATSFGLGLYLFPAAAVGLGVMGVTRATVGQGMKFDIAAGAAAVASVIAVVLVFNVAMAPDAPKKPEAKAPVAQKPSPYEALSRMQEEAVRSEVVALPREEIRQLQTAPAPTQADRETLDAANKKLDDLLK